MVRCAGGPPFVVVLLSDNKRRWLRMYRRCIVHHHLRRRVLCETCANQQRSLRVAHCRESWPIPFGRRPASCMSLYLYTRVEEIEESLLSASFSINEGSSIWRRGKEDWLLLMLTPSRPSGAPGDTVNELVVSLATFSNDGSSSSQIDSNPSTKCLYPLTKDLKDFFFYSPFALPNQLFPALSSNR